MTVHTGQQPQLVKHPDRTINPVPRPLAMHREAAPPFTQLGRLATTMQPLPPTQEPVQGETKSSCTEPRARCETEEACSQGRSLLHWVNSVLGGYADDVGTSRVKKLLAMYMAECKDSDLYMDEDSDFYSDEDCDQGYEYGDGRCNDDCDPDGWSYGSDLEDVYDIDDGGIVSGLDVVPDSMHRDFQSNAEESDESFVDISEDPDVVSDEAEADTSQDPDASYTDMPQNPDIETGVAFANTSQEHETEAEVSFCDTSRGQNVEADMSKSDTSQDHDTVFHKTFADTSQDHDTESHKSFADTSQDHDTESHKSFADTSQDRDTESHKSFADTSQDHDTESHKSFADTSRDHDTETPVSFADTSQAHDTESHKSFADTSQDHDTESPVSFSDTSQDHDTESPVSFSDTSQAPDTESHKSFADTSQDHDIVSPMSFADPSQDHAEPGVSFCGAPEDQTFEGDQDIESHVSASGTCHDQNAKSCVSGNGTLPPRGKCHSQDTVSECIGSNKKKQIFCLSISKGKICLDKKNSAGMKRSGNESICFTNSSRQPAALIQNRSVAPNLATNMPKSVFAQTIYTQVCTPKSTGEICPPAEINVKGAYSDQFSGKLPLSVQVSDEMLFSYQVRGAMSPSAQHGKKSLSAQSSSKMVPSAEGNGESPSAQVSGGESPSAHVSGESPSAQVSGEGFSAVLSGGKPPPGQVGSECFAAVQETAGFSAPVQVTAGLPVPGEAVGEMAFAVSE